MKLNRFIIISAGIFFLAVTCIQTKADDRKLDPTGAYAWTMAGYNGNLYRTNILVLQLEGTNLTGKITSPMRNGSTNVTEIANGRIIGADISFFTVRTYKDNAYTNNYSGTLTNDAIKGKIEFQRDGEIHSRDWIAKKQEK